jgi:hypothetical protein
MSDPAGTSQPTGCGLPRGRVLISRAIVV